MTPGTISALLAIMVILSAVPGPSDFAVVARSASLGFRHGVLLTSGIVLADFVFIFLAVFGLSAVADLLGNLFVFVQCLCALYLVWLGIQVVRYRRVAGDNLRDDKYSQTSSFLAGFLITLGDPKAILFYMGLLPAFVQIGDITIRDIVVIMIVATIAIGGVKLSYAYLAARAVTMFQSSNVQSYLSILAGCLLVATGIFVGYGALAVRFSDAT